MYAIDAYGHYNYCLYYVPYKDIRIFSFSVVGTFHRISDKGEVRFDGPAA